MEHYSTLSMCILLPDDVNELEGITDGSVWIGPVWSLIAANLQHVVILPSSDTYSNTH